jgi:hypothetical protein
MRLLYLATFLILGGCSNPDPKLKAGGDSRPSVPWKESMIQGASFDSIPDSGIVYLGFPKTGNTVAATIGDRNDALAAPLWYWAIDSSGALVLSDYSGKREAAIELIEFKSAEVTVRNGKDVIHYKRTKK